MTFFTNIWQSCWQVWVRKRCKILCLKGQCHEIFASGSFHESVFPQPQSIPLRPFRIFSKIRGDIRSSRFATGVNDTGSKWKKTWSRKILIILFGHLWVVELTYINFCLCLCHRYCWHPRQICHRCQWQYQTADTWKWTWRQKFIYMFPLLPKGDQQNY